MSDNIYVKINIFGMINDNDNDNINESCQNNSKLHLNKKGTNLFSKNILTSLDII